MERPDSFAETPSAEHRPSSAVELQRQQRRLKRLVGRVGLLFIAGPACLALLALVVFSLTSGSGWSLLGIPLVALAALISFAVPLLVPALFVLGAWALYRTYYKKPAAASAAGPASADGGMRPASDGGPSSPAPTFAGDIALLEELRAKLAAEARRRTKLFVPLGVGAALLLFYMTIGRGSSSKDSPLIALVLFTVIGGGGAWIWAVAGPGGRYRQAFKDRLIPRLLATYGDLRHSVGAPPDLSRAVAAGFLPAYDRLTADDGFTGRYRDYPIDISEVAATRKEGKRTVTLFQGLYVEIGVSSPFRGTTIVRDREGWQPANSLQKLNLEDPVFDEIYAAWSTDQIEGRAVLTPAVMERLLVMADGKSFLPPLFLIGGDKMNFALPAVLPGTLFEPPGLETHVAAQQLASLQADFARVFALADAMIDMHIAVQAPHEAPPSSPVAPPRFSTP